MKLNMKISITVAALMLFSLLVLPGSFALSNNEYTDRTGDVEYVGIEDSALHDDIDITILTADISGDPIVLELTTVDGIILDASGMDYNYYFYLDLTGDDTVGATVIIKEDDQYVSGDTVEGTNTPISGISGEGTSTLRVELPLDIFSSTPTIDDVSALSEIKDGGYWARDYVNRDFQGGQSNVEITPPSDNDDPGEATPTNPSLGLSIDSFTMETTSTETSYDYSIQATGTGSDDIIKGFYCIWGYGDGGGHPQQIWKESPIDEENLYGSHEYKEEFFGTGAGGSWTTWKWTFHSSGPIDDNNRDRFEDPDTYWTGLESMVLYVRGYDADGNWDQDSEDITEEYTGTSSSSSSDDGDDDDTDDDDTVDDDTSDDDDDGDDSPGFEISLIVAALVIFAVIIVRRKRN